MVSAIHRHIQQYNLGAIVTPRWLVWAMTGTRTETAILSAQLINVTVQDYAQTGFAKLITDSEIEVSGMLTCASESVRTFIGLGDGAAGNKFKEILINAAAAAKK